MIGTRRSRTFTGTAKPNKSVKKPEIDEYGYMILEFLKSDKEKKEKSPFTHVFFAKPLKICRILLQKHDVKLHKFTSQVPLLISAGLIRNLTDYTRSSSSFGQEICEITEKGITELSERKHQAPTPSVKNNKEAPSGP